MRRQPREPIPLEEQDFYTEVAQNRAAIEWSRSRASQGLDPAAAAKVAREVLGIRRVR